MDKLNELSEKVNRIERKIADMDNKMTDNFNLINDSNFIKVIIQYFYILCLIKLI